MKKVLLLSAMCALLATGCAKQENNGWKPGTVQFVITAGGAETRAIYSEEDIVPTISNVNVYAFVDDVYTATIPVPGWTNDGVTMTLTEADSNILPAGDYKFLAVGRVAADGFNLPDDFTGLGYDEAIAELQVANVVGDIYAGIDAETLTDEGGRVEIDMTRKVAGIMGYFVNVPAVMGGKTVGYMRLTMDATNTAVDLTDGTGSAPSGNTFDVLEFDFTAQTPVDGVYPGIDLSGEGVVTLPNSYLNGAFVMPVEATFTLGLYDADTTNTVALKTWTVNGGDPLAIDANFLYTIGQKKQAGNTNGGTSDDPTPTPDDDDMGFDLTSDQELTITISPEWEDVVIITVE